MHTLTLILSDHLVVLLLTFPLALLLAAFLPLQTIEARFVHLLQRIERKLNKRERGPVMLRMRGLLVSAALILGSIILAATLKAFTLLLIDGVWFDIMLGALLIPLFPLLDGLWKSHRLLREGSRAEAVTLLAPLTDRDLEERDIHLLCRAAIEQSATGISNRLISPLFWYLLMGLPGLLLARLTALLEHRFSGPGREHFGWAAERMAAVLHFFPARLAAAIILLASAFTPSGQTMQALRTMLRDGHRVLVPNDGWPISCISGALGISLGGPKRVNGLPVNMYWANSKDRSMAVPQDVLRAFILMVTAILLLWLLIASGAWALYLR